jgi:hypothetical protein
VEEKEEKKERKERKKDHKGLNGKRISRFCPDYIFLLFPSYIFSLFLSVRHHNPLGFSTCVRPAAAAARVAGEQILNQCHLGSFRTLPQSVSQQSVSAWHEERAIERERKREREKCESQPASQAS